VRLYKFNFIETNIIDNFNGFNNNNNNQKKEKTARRDKIKTLNV